MLASDIVRMLLVALMSVLVLTGSVQLWMVYVLSFAFGLVDGFFMPASGSMMPRVVAQADLPAGNSLFQGTGQLLNFVGPALAGGLIAWAGRPSGAAHASADLTGIGVALVIDAFTFLVSVVTLWLMRGEAVTAAASEADTDGNILSAIKAGFLYLWRDPVFRTLFLLMAATNFLFVGTMSVGLPVLANIRLAEGAAAFGLIMGAYAAGNLLGYLVAGAIPTRRGIGLLTIAILIGFGPATAGLGFVTRTWLAFVLLFVMGLGNGYLSIFLISWLQKRTRRDMLGHVMSLVMLSNLGLAPLSQALAGGIIKLTFVGLVRGLRRVDRSGRGLDRYQARDTQSGAIRASHRMYPASRPMLSLLPYACRFTGQLAFQPVQPVAQIGHRLLAAKPGGHPSAMRSAQAAQPRAAARSAVCHS